MINFDHCQVNGALRRLYLDNRPFGGSKVAFGDFTPRKCRGKAKVRPEGPDFGY